MVELTSAGRAMIEALIAGPVAWRSPGELAGATGLGLEEATDHLADLDAGGWLAAWERPGELVVTLSVEAAARLEVRLVESGPSMTPRWARRAEPEPPEPRSPGLFRGERAARLDLVVDPRPRPEGLADLAEEAEALADPAEGGLSPGAIAKLPRPTILVGTGLSPWPSPGPGPCPACRLTRLGPSMYCLCCDRWGLDHLLRAGSAPRPHPRLDPEEQARRADRERQVRKRKRRSRRSAQVAARRKGRPSSHA